MIFYSEIDYYNHRNNKLHYNYIKGTNTYYGIGVGWNLDYSPVFIIERVEDVLIEEGTQYDPPVYEPEGVETILVKPKLRRY